MNTKFNFKQIHDNCGWHEKDVLKSKLCGCFYCVSIFSTSEINEWIDEPNDCPRGQGRTAVCPNCGIDAVLPESDQYKITNELLEAMQNEWF